jgi:hypothetical protein
MGLGWNWTGWQRAAAAAQRGFEATRPRLSGLREWLNTGWNQPEDEHDSVDPFMPPTAPRPTTPRQAQDRRP